MEKDIETKGVLHQDVQERLDRMQFKQIAQFREEVDNGIDVEYKKVRLERVILVGVQIRGQATALQAQNSLDELVLLAQTAGAEVLGTIMQARSLPDRTTYIGKGKTRELASIVKEQEADTVIFDSDLLPSQRRAVEDVLKVKVIDRTALILDIFAQHAKSREGKAQVELAQLQYLLPRLRGWGAMMSRQAGGQVGGQGAGMGSRGPGETQLELDRRRINTKIALLKKSLAKMKTSRDVKRKRRIDLAVPSVVIVGYTNAGKSSLLNAITDEYILVQDALFATLDTTSRKTKTDGGIEYTITDTVGFIQNLPTTLIEAFRSTLEETVDADVLLHIVDASAPEIEANITAVYNVLNTIDSEQGAVLQPASPASYAKAPHTPLDSYVDTAPLRSALSPLNDTEGILLVFNKTDLLDDDQLHALKERYPDALYISAKTGAGIANLKTKLAEKLASGKTSIDVLVPYADSGKLTQIYESGQVLKREDTADGVRIKALVSINTANSLARFAFTES